MQLGNKAALLATALMRRWIVFVTLCLAAHASPASATSVSERAATDEGNVWVISGNNVRYVAPGNRPVATIDIASWNYGMPRLLAVDPYDHSVWVITAENLLAHFDARGELRGGHTLPSGATALGVALDQTVWVAGSRDLWQFGDAALPLRSLTLNERWHEPVVALAVDSLRDMIWLVGPSSIARVDSLAGLSEMIAAGDEIRASALDPRTGRMWLVVADELVSYGADGRFGGSMQLDSIASDDAIALRYDGATDRLNLTVQDDTRSIDHHARKVERPHQTADAEPFQVLPQLSLLRPPQDASTSERQPEFLLQVDSLCNHLPCDLPPLYLENLQLIASLNGQSVADQFRFDPVAAQSSFAPGTPLPIGSNEFSAHVVDRFGHRSNMVDASLTVLDSGRTTITPKANQVPSISLTAPANNSTFVAGSNIAVTAMASDPDGTVMKVEFFQGSTLINTSMAPPYTVIWGSVPAGTYKLTAKATDSQNGTKTSTVVNITVVAPKNVAPSVSIGSPVNESVVNGPNITIAAIANDTDGTVNKVDFYDGATLLGTFNGGTATVNATWSWTNATPGSHTIKAIATDNSGATASAMATIMVNAAPYVVITSPTNCAEIISPANLVVTADALDNDGSIARVDFYQGTVLLGSAAHPPYAISWPNVAIGSYSLTAVATDDRGARRTSNPVSVSVQPPDNPPSVSITAPSDGATFGLGAAIPVTATAADTDGSITKVEFFGGKTLIGTATSAPFTITWVPASADTYTVTAKATDNRRVATASTGVRVDIVADKAPAITLTSPTSGATFVAGATINLTATAADSDGTISKVEFFAGSMLVGTATTTPYAATWSNVAGGSYTLTAKATDNLGVSTTSTGASIYVDRAPVVTMLEPADNSTYAIQSHIVFKGYATDADSVLTKMELLKDGVSLGSCMPAPTTSSYTCTWDWWAVGGGNFTFAWRATDEHAAVSMSIPVHIAVNTVPIIKIISPVANSTLSAPATIEIVATATETVGTIAKVDFYANGVLIGTRTGAPYQMTWANVSMGTYTLTAVATDNVGTNATSPAVSVAIEPFALNIISPTPAEAIYDGMVYVSGTFSGAVPTSITVNGVAAVLGTATFGAAVSYPSNNLISATANVGGATVTKTVGIQRGTVAFGSVGSVPSMPAVHDDNVMINGYIDAPPNSAVFVNGIVATLKPNNEFFVNNVPLTIGSNAITLTLNAPNHPSVQQTYTVSSDAVAAFALDVSPDTGMAAPHDVTVTLTNRNLLPYSTLEADFNGNAIYEYSEPGPATPVAQRSFIVTYQQSGTYDLRLRLKDAAGQSIYFAVRRIHVGDAGSFAAKLRNVYTGMLDRLRTGNIAGAVEAISDTVRERYRNVFIALGPNLPRAIEEFGIVRSAIFSDDHGEVLITRDKADGAYGYRVLMIRDADGIWRIDGM